MLKKLKSFFKVGFEHQGFLKYLKNTGWLFGGQMLRMVLGLFVSVAVARYLGPADFGLYNFVLSIVALIAVVASLGLENLAKRELVEHPDQRDEILGSCFTLSAIACVLAYALLLWLVAVTGADIYLIGIYALLGGTLLVTPFKFIETWFQSQVRGNLSVISTSVSLLLFAAVKVAAIIAGLDFTVFCYIFLFESVALVLIRAYMYVRHYHSILHWRASLARGKWLLVQSWPMILSGLAITVYMRIDQVMLGAMATEADVGNYAAATRISSVWYFIPSILAASLFPAIVNAKKQGAEIYRERLQRYFDLNVALSYLIILPVSVLSGWIILTLYGDAYSEAGPILLIHVWASLFVFIGVARGQFLVAEGMFKFSMLATVGGAVVNVALNLILIPKYSGLGAAIATLLSYFISAYLSSLFYPKTYGVFLFQTKSLILVPSIIKLAKTRS